MATQIEEFKKPIKLTFGALAGIVFGVFLATSTYLTIQHTIEKLTEYHISTNSRIDKKTARLEKRIEALEEELKELKEK